MEKIHSAPTNFGTRLVFRRAAVIPNNPLPSRIMVLGSGTAVLLIPLTSKAPIWLLACGVHVFPRSLEKALVPCASLLERVSKIDSASHQVLTCEIGYGLSFCHEE